MESVRFDEVSKRFVIHHERARTFQEAALNLLRLRGRNGSSEEFWALRDVSLSVERGRTLGIVGRNGSGKSTLLKLLAGTMRPTRGEVIARGRVFGLLELAAGFHPDLSGRENVFLNGTFLGFSRRDMAERLEQIVSFAELEQFIDTPVKHYSSGMYMRLGFAIAISVDPDILVIDEVLAVGDAAFRQKCFRALADFKARQKTILFVTHDASAVRRFCDDAIWLDAGQVRTAGPAADVLREYLAATQSTHGPALATGSRPPDSLAEPAGPVTLLGVTTVDESGGARHEFRTGERIGVQVRFRCEAPCDHVSIGVGLHRTDGLYLMGTRSGPADLTTAAPAGEAEVCCWLGPLPLASAAYTLSAMAWVDGVPSHRLSQAARFAVEPPATDQAGPLVLPVAWEVTGAIASAAAEGGDRARRGLQPPATLAKDAEAPWRGARFSGLRRSSRAASAPGAESARENPTPVGDSLFPTHREGTKVADGTGPPTRFHARWRRPPARVAMGAGEDEFLGDGWYPPEDWPPCIRWTAGRAALYLTQDEWATSVGITMCRPQHTGALTTGRIYVAGRESGRFELATVGLEPFTFPVEPVETAQEVEIVLEIDRPFEPAAAGASDDPRVLGVAVREVWLE
jgi:lipopolysaccharide transport system ATP-binding protein